MNLELWLSFVRLIYKKKQGKKSYSLINEGFGTIYLSKTGLYKFISITYAEVDHSNLLIVATFFRFGASGGCSRHLFLVIKSNQFL
ncbi:hypothetical protein GH741_17640 [Aquibacillus halophilus]|uniref:Uncharacterized protein n=1 Tax=Aquibacillus halophilus TaxID=930132 RepID=A0A6A8DGV9_9BACI|nr:hypothetical protein [Aquibacillus halophilus]